MENSPGGENDLLPNRSETCHHHSQAHSDQRLDPLDDTTGEPAKSHRGIGQGSLLRYHMSFRVTVGIRCSQGVGERDQEMVELGRLTSGQIIGASENRHGRCTREKLH